MDVSPVAIVGHLSELVNSRYPESNTSPPNQTEKLIAEELASHLDKILMDYVIDEDEILEEITDSDCSSFSQQLIVDDEGSEVKTSHTDGCTIERKMEILKLVDAHPKWKLSTLQKNGAPELLYLHYKQRWAEQIKRGGTRFEQWKFIDEYTWQKFTEARKELKTIKGSDLRLWALQAAQSFRDPTFQFTASEAWTTRFKGKHGISSRKITNRVSKRDVISLDAIKAAAEAFQADIKEIAAKYDAHLVLNTDQCGFVYEIIANRTQSFAGEKLTVALGKSPNNLATHSYTVQYIIAMDGSIIGDVFVCFQEKGGKMGEQVKSSLFMAPNVTVTCSSSGKLTTSLYEYFLDNVLLKSVNEDFLFIVDSWSGQTNEKSYNGRFGPESGKPSCCLKIIPKKCTGLCQPLDTTFHRQLKYLARAIFAEMQLNYNEDVNPVDEITTRNNITRLHSLIHNQLSASVFKPMIRYSWFSAGLTDEKPLFKSVKEVCFTFDPKDTVECSKENCKNNRFIKCSRCEANLCFLCFFYEYHFHFEKLVTN